MPAIGQDAPGRGAIGGIFWEIGINEVALARWVNILRDSFVVRIKSSVEMNDRDVTTGLHDRVARIQKGRETLRQMPCKPGAGRQRVAFLRIRLTRTLRGDRWPRRAHWRRNRPSLFEIRLDR